MHRTFLLPPCFERDPPPNHSASDGSNPFQRASMGAASLWRHIGCTCVHPLSPPHLPGGPCLHQLGPNLLPSGLPPLPLCGPIPAAGAVFPARVCAISMLINPEPEAIRLQRLYEMCLVVVCFFLISANCIFREKGPEPQREIKKKTTQEKDCGRKAVEGGGKLPRVAGPALKQTWVHRVGPRAWSFGEPFPFPGWKGEGRMEVSSLCT